MEMTKTEIIRKYKQQESKAQQKRSIEEMAQLNGCSRAEIACILLEEN